MGEAEIEKMKNYRVAIEKNKNAAKAVRGAIELIGGIGSFIRPGHTVLIKPNCLTEKYTSGTVTSKEVVAALALLVTECGGKAVIGENNLKYDPSDKNFDISCARHYYDGLAEFGLERDVPLIDLMADEMVDVEIAGARVFKNTKIAKSVLEADKIIDAAVMKTHDQTRVTLGIKNLKGVIPLSEKKRSHGLGVEQAIVDLSMLIKPAIIVIDGMTAAEGMGPAGGDPVKMDLIIAGTNTLATDMVGAAVMGYDISTIKFIEYAIESGIGPNSIDEIDVLGYPIDSVCRQFVTAESIVKKQYDEMGINIVSKDVCSGCWAEFRHIYYSLGEERTALTGTTFVLGQVEETACKDKCVVIGKCAKSVANQGIFVKGCPPDHKEIEKAARKVVGLPVAGNDPFEV